MLFAASCGDNEIANQAPSFGFQKDRIVRVNEGSTDIGTFQAADADGDLISYSISNLDMSITEDGLVTFNIIPDFEIENVYHNIKASLLPQWVNTTLTRKHKFSSENNLLTLSAEFNGFKDFLKWKKVQ